jgi:prepilin-type N-terminal cleavage/methylation domain-containing protein
MLKVIRPLFVPLRKLKLSRGGFTLVELLVVIGIIAILAGVALGPITGAIKNAKNNAAMQTTRTLALAEFQYANDNNQNYPDTGNSGASGGTQAAGVANCLMSGGYIQDPSIFWISGSQETKYTGSLSTPTIAASNISYDFVGNSNGQGVNPNAPDTLPLVWTSVSPNTPTLTSSGAVNVTVTNTNPLSTQGIAVCYKSNSAQFMKAVASNNQPTVYNFTPQVYPGWPAVVLSGGG